MPTILITVFLIGALVFAARVVGAHSSRLFSTSDEILSSELSLTPRQRRFIEEVDRHPHDLLLTAGLFKSLVLTLGSMGAVYLAVQLHSLYSFPQLPTAVPAVGLFWLFYIFVVEIIPPGDMSEDSPQHLPTPWGLVSLLHSMFRPIHRLAGIFNARYAEERRDEEKKEEIVERAIETLAEGIGTDEPIIEEDERQMIQQIFRLDTTEVKEVMVPRINIVAIPRDTSLEQLRQIVRAEGHSRIPVYQDDLDSIIGIVYAKDIFCSEPTAPEDFHLRDFIRKPLIVPETQKIDKLMEEFRRRRNHLAIVVDEYGGTAGLVSLEDIIEEIVGEIEDEHDSISPEIVPGDDGSLLVSGQVPLEDITEHFELRPFSEEFETVGGLIYDLVGGVPTVGKVLTKPPLRLTVIKVDGQRIIEVKVEKLSGGNENSNRRAGPTT